MALKQNSAGANTTKILSQNRSLHWLFIGIGLLLTLIVLPAILDIPKEFSRGNKAILVVLVFPLFGFWLGIMGWRQKKQSLFFGETPLSMSPALGQAGGQLGASIQFNHSKRQIDVKARISCISVNRSSSNSSSSSSVLWQKETEPYIKDIVGGSELRVRFDIPEEQRVSSYANGKKGKIYWQVSVEGIVENRQFKREWVVPVVRGNGKSELNIPEEHTEAHLAEVSRHATASAENQIESAQSDSETTFVSESGRNSEMSGGFMLFGGLFALAGAGMLYAAVAGNSVMWFFGLIFFSVGMAILLLGVYLKGRELECKIDEQTLFACRSLFGKVWKNHYVNIDCIRRLELKRTMSSQSAGKLTEYLAVYAHVYFSDGTYKKVKLVEGIKGRDVGEVILERMRNVIESSPNCRLENALEQ